MGIARVSSTYIFSCFIALRIIVSLDGTVYGAPGPEQLVQKADEYFMRFDHFKGTWVVAYGSIDSDVRGEERKWEMLKDGRKVKVMALGRTAPELKVPPGAENASERELEQLREMHRRRHVPKEFISVPGESNLHVYDKDVLLDEVQPTEETANRIIGNTPFALYYGYLLFKPIPELLRSMNLTARVVELDGRETHVLSGEGKDGSLNIQLWFDPSLEYVIPRIEFQQRLSHPGVADRYVKVIHRQSNFRRRDGPLVPMSAVQTVVTPPMPRIFRDDKESVTRLDGSGNIIMNPEKIVVIYQELERFDYNPTFVAADFKPSVQIDEGARVQMLDARQLQYEWKEGRGVPVAPDIPTGFAFIQNGRPTARLFLVIGGVLLLVFIAGTHYRRQKPNAPRSSPQAQSPKTGE